MATKLIKLKTNTGDILLPQTTINNLVGADNVTKVQVPILDANGHIDTSYIPSTIDDVIELIAMQSTAPEHCSEGDKYFNNAAEGANAKKIFTATATDTWSTTGEDPQANVIYLDQSDNRIWRWSGSQMVEISKQVATTTTVRPTGEADNSVVPTEAAVRNAITASEYSLPAATTTSLGGVIVDETDSNGVNLAVDASGNLSVNAGTAGVSAYGTVQLAQASDIVEDPATANTTKAVTPVSIAAALAGKQPILSNTTNVTVSGNSISVADAGNNTKGVVTINGSTNAADLNSGSITLDYNNSLSTYAVVKGLETKQDDLIPDTNYIAMSGASITTVLQWEEVTA